MPNPYSAKSNVQYLVASEPVLEVPAGTIKEVMAWVDNDPERAQLALDTEVDRPKDDVRSSLVNNLQELIDNA